MSGIVNKTGAVSGVIGTTVGTPSSAAGTCSFLARKASDAGWLNLSANNRLAFDNVSTGESHDTDSCYDTSSYEFEAPAAGVYLFWFSLYTAQSDTSNAFCFKKNDVAAGFDINVGGANNLTFNSVDTDHIQNGTIVFTLASSDCVAVMSISTSDVYLAHSSWGGCRLK